MKKRIIGLKVCSFLSIAAMVGMLGLLAPSSALADITDISSITITANSDNTSGHVPNEGVFIMSNGTPGGATVKASISVTSEGGGGRRIH